MRRQVPGLAHRDATADEQRRMELLVEQAMKDGAVGLSTGLIYLPGQHSSTDEVVGPARAAARHRGLYASHIRSHGNRVVEAINEALANWGRLPAGSPACLVSDVGRQLQFAGGGS